MPVRKNLTEMYQVGRELTFREGERPLIDAETGEQKKDPETGEPLFESDAAETVWVSKLTQLDHRTAVRRADARKSVLLTAAHNRDGEDWHSSMTVARESFAERDAEGRIIGVDRQLVIDFLVANKLAERQEAIGAEVEGDDDENGDPSEWKKDNYLQGLYDAWNGVGLDEGADSMKVRYAINPNDQEAKRTYEEIARFVGEVDKRLEEERQFIVAEFNDLDEEQLMEQVCESHLKSYADAAWMEEFNACRVWLCLRKAEKHHEYYLRGGRDDVDKLHPTIYSAVVAAIDEMTIPVTEGKGLPATRTSSH